MKGSKIFAVISGLIISGLMTGCIVAYGRGNGDVISRERGVEKFNGVTLSGVADINIHFADKHKVVVTTDSNLQDFVTIATENNMLDVGLKRKLKYVDILVDVYLPELDMINLRGIGDIMTEKGEGLNLEIRHSGVGTIGAERYRVENADITYSGVGDIRVWATNSLNGNSSGGGNIEYKGAEDKYKFSGDRRN